MTAIVILDDNGEEFGRLDLPEGSVKHFIIKNEMGFSDAFQVIGDDNAIKFFNFCRHSMEVEWSLMLCGNPGNGSINFLSTSHMKNSEYGPPILYENLHSVKYPIREISHTHPQGTEVPSDGNKGDLPFARKVCRGDYKNVIFKIWVPQKDEPIIFYSPESKNGNSTNIGIEIEDLTKNINCVY